MSLSNALFSSVTGLNTNSTAISVIGDNIANVNTPGFKERRAEFADVLGQTISSAGGFSQIGAGSKLNRVSTIFTQGTFEDTGRPTDLAIEGRGFFILDGDQGRFYSRAGIFGFDDSGFMTTSDGRRVQGFGIDPVTGQPDGQLGDIVLNTAVSSPQATGNVDVSLNLDATATTIPGGFDATDINTANASSNDRTVVTVFDSQGNAHAATVWFTKTAANSWDFTVTLPDASGNPVPQGGGGVPTGSLQFDASGQLDVVSPGLPAAVNMNYGGGVAAGTINLNFGPALTTAGGTGDATTQFASDFATNSLVQDGFAAGNLQSIVIDRQGFLSGQFSNGETQQLAQLALANFANVEGLLSVGNNSLQETRQSGQALVGSPQTGNLGAIRASALEQSNVDLAAQFVRMIVNQRAFQANTRTVSTTNELLANLVNLGQ